MDPRRPICAPRVAAIAAAAALLCGVQPAEARRQPSPRADFARRLRPAIIGTIGPSSEGRVLPMLRAGLTVARINLSHNGSRSTRRVVSQIRAAGKALGRQPTLLFDLPGGKARLGEVGAKAVTLAVGQRFELVSGGKRLTTTSKRAWVDYKALGAQLRVGDRVMIDDGKLVLRVDGMRAGRVQTTVEVGGKLGSRKGMAIRGRDLPFPTMTAKDRRKLKIAVANGAQWIGVSMVQKPENLHAVRRALDRLGAHDVKLVAKVESHRAMKNLDAIIGASDIVMIARGDLGVAVGGRRQLLRAQAKIAGRCRALGKPFIAATGFMSAMENSPRPSRNNRRDVRRARGQGAGYIMLNETAIGSYPVLTIKALADLLR